MVSLRSKVDRIQVWTRSKEDVERINGIGRKLVKLLDISEADGIGLEFQVSLSVSQPRLLSSHVSNILSLYRFPDVTLYTFLALTCHLSPTCSHGYS